MKRTFLLLIFILITIWSYTQTVTVCNRITAEPVENVAVFNQDYSISTLSNENGLVDLSIFEHTDSIFFQHPSFVKLGLPYTTAITKAKIKLDKKVILIPEFVITASKYKERKIDISQTIDIISARELRLLPTQNSADVLLNTGNVFVQKTQGGGGSPVLRGFEANKILLVIDGIRMNNCIYRSGHLQNSITIDNAILDRVEIVYGPSSVIYGSDALGGTIHYLTKSPELSQNNKINFGANAYAQVATGNQSEKVHVDFNVANTRVGSLTSFTRSSFGDIRMGKNRSPLLGDFGKCFNYTERINGKDSMMVNPNPLIQKRTGYDQLDLLQKFKFKISQTNTIEFNLQHSTSSNIDRYDNLSTYTGDSTLKYAEWYYGPQDRTLASVKHVYNSTNKYFTNVTTILAYQNIEESRHTRKFGKTSKIHQYENLNILSGNIDFLKKFRNESYMHYGFDAQFDKLKSNAYTEDITRDTTTFALSRYPDDGSIYWNNSLFAAFKTRLSEKLNVSAGVRYNYTLVEFKYKNKFNVLDTTHFQKVNHAVTGTLGFVYKKSNYTRFLLNLATGYRNPNLDDISKVRPKGNDILLPNQDLKPEYTYNAELGFSHTFDGYIRFSASYFASYLTDAIVRTKYFSMTGADTMQYDGDYYTAYVNTNAEKAIIHGFNAMLESDLNSNLSFRGSLNYTYGRNITTNSPMPHIPPLHGRAEITYRLRKITYDIYALYNGWKLMNDMSDAGEDNQDYGTAEGFPSWYTLNTQLSYDISPNLLMQLTVENVTDNFYIPFASCVAAVGFNFIATLRVTI